MIATIERAHAQPWHQVLRQQASFSEYYLYGLFLDCVAGLSGVAETQTSFCHSWWPDPGATAGAIALDPQLLLAGAGPGNVALAIQSTDPMPLEVRTRLFSLTNPQAPAGLGGAE
jgi:hypothetical protein